jgi:ribosomal protein S18 acetylase RimI-like enzyme
MITAGLQSKVRRARAKDSAALTRIFAESWRSAYRGIIPNAHLECLIGRRGDAWWKKAIRTESHLMVIEAGGKVAGYASCGVSRGHAVYKGEIYELYLDPLYQGLGLGGHLFESCRAELDKQNLDGLVVWALEDNDAAAQFYRCQGGRPVARSMVAFGPAKLGKIAYAWR